MTALLVTVRFLRVQAEKQLLLGAVAVAVGRGRSALLRQSTALQMALVPEGVAGVADRSAEREQDATLPLLEMRRHCQRSPARRRVRQARRR